MSKRLTPEEIEARTIYIPQDDRTRPVSIRMYEAEQKRGLRATETVPYALHDAAAVFKLLSEDLSTGLFARNDPGVISLTNICAAHFKSLAENEGEHLMQLAQNLQHRASAEGGEEKPK
ncbi:hypothetical protein [Tabrizicola sp.]|uniref:hypothetical protein n=1 Tax=Tabrizicola sp. TaxID=2005166 RepID=UPI0035B187FE